MRLPRSPRLHDVPELLTAAQLHDTVGSIAVTQEPCGALPWPDGHTDPWDHVECAMALVLGGRLEQARRAYAWLEQTQARDGSWATSWSGLTVLDRTVDTNQVAYVAVGVWQWWVETGDRTTVRELWPTVKRALDWVVGMQQPHGALGWSRDPHGRPNTEGLLTGSSSSYQSLRCGIALAELLGDEQPEWELAAGQLQHAVAHHPEAFLDKSRFSMDWYYPVLGGAVRGEAAETLLERRWDEFVVPGVGARCVSDRPWVTGAETAELVLSLLCVGQDDRARALLADVQHLREQDGSYWTGLVFDEGVRWPVERSAWTAAAVVLAADAIVGGGSLALFRGDQLPTGVLLASCEDHGAAVSG